MHARDASPSGALLVDHRCRLDESRTELHAMLDRAPFSDDSGARLPLLVFLNKADRPGAISPADATAALRLDDLGGPAVPRAAVLGARGWRHRRRAAMARG